MGNYDIAFPNLGIYLSNVPKNFSVFGLTIAWYGVIIAVGMLAGVFLAAHIAKKSGQNPDLYWDFFIWASIFSIIGARIYYVIFQWDLYKDNPIKVFNLREGGIAIYGAVIGAFLTALIYTRIKKISMLLLTDTAVAGLILGQAIGRWGNFFNREVFGDYTDCIFAMRIPIVAVRTGDMSEMIIAHIGNDNFIQVHPTFLYECLWNLGVLVLILLWYKRRKFDGECTLLYFFGYGIGRAWIEGIRTDQLYLIGTKIPVSQVLAIVTASLALIIDVIVRIKLKKKEQETPEEIKVMEAKLAADEAAKPEEVPAETTKE